MPKVMDQLRAAFGDSADRLDVSACSVWLDAEAGPVRLVIDKDSSLFVLCGGEVIAEVPTTSMSTRQTFYIVVDDSAGNQWDYRRRSASTEELLAAGEYHTPRPRQRLRLVASA